MHRRFADTVTACDYSENIIVVKTLPGGANTVASALDHANWTEVIGTVAGDDNIIMVIKPKEATEKILHRLQSYLK
jgi:transcriptional regulator of arginine metabolism